MIILIAFMDSFCMLASKIVDDQNYEIVDENGGRTENIYTSVDVLNFKAFYKLLESSTTVSNPPINLEEYRIKLVEEKYQKAETIKKDKKQHEEISSKINYLKLDAGDHIRYITNEVASETGKQASETGKQASETGKQASETSKQASEREISETINNLKQQAKTVLERISKTQIDFTTLQKQIEKEKNEQIRELTMKKKKDLELEVKAKEAILLEQEKELEAK